ncbi:protein phosphatase [Promicromonospora sp. AC04]|uniref:MerR family transcriptional regulator n=1 Tax=Promicromonospora sp. AC04 TaxID=2135723 RepID=UPI000D4EDC2A|nr:MerR family transcriptional regulator [Promicromonospora sp. AC04]PUB26166.1 protein phosphatase [Promicromonospora sp. AC04]
MEHLSIGEFARASGLTPKALRLYDDLGLLRPDRVDPFTGYRWYVSAQLDRARLVAQLRLIGMPLARIREVASAPSGMAADAVQAYWRQVEADTASRRAIVSELLVRLRTKESTMERTGTTLAASAAARMGIGGRSSMNDACLVRPGLIAVADGFGDDQVASIALHTFAQGVSGAGVSDAGLAVAVEQAAEAARVRAERADHAGTTLTAVLLDGDQGRVVHIGDTRAWLVRDGGAEPLTRDHTVAAALVEEGRLTEDEARSHPDRALLNRAFGGAPEWAEPDVFVVDLLPGDRLVLTADGVHAVLEPEHLARLLTHPGEPDDVTQQVADAVEAAGAPDNYLVVVADLDAAASAA